jgi:VanZ family protein
LDYKQTLFRVVFILWITTITVLSLVESENFSRIDVKNSDKFAHFVFYFWLTILMFLAIPKQKFSFRFLVIFSFSFSVIYGIIIEILQGVITEKRQPELFDVFANTFGSFIAALVIYKLFPKVKFLK